MIRAGRLLASTRRSQQVALTNGRAAATSQQALSTLTPSRFSSALLEKNAMLSASRPTTALRIQRRWQSTSPDSLPPPAQASDEIRNFLEELNGCRETGNWRQALKLLDRIDKHGHALDPQMYERAIAACARMGKVEVLPGLLQNMNVDDILPTSATVDYIMQAYLAREEWKLIVDHAVDVTGKGVPLSDAAFHATMEACGQMRDAYSAKTVFNNLWKKCGMAVDASHYAATIRAVGMGGRPDIAVNLFTIMEEKAGIKADEGVFNQLIRAQIVNQALPQALQTFATVNDRGLVLHEPIYTATIDALIKNSDYWQAGRLFDQMISYGMNPSVFCYGRIMVAYVRTGKNNVALACWKKIVEANEPTPALMKYTKLLQELATTSDSKLTLAVFDHIYETFDHDVIRDATYSLAIRANGRLGRTQTAIDLFDTFVASRRASGKSLPRAAGIYLSVFNALSRDTERDPKQNTLDAKRVWDIMVQSVPVILPPAYASLAGVFAASGELDTLNVLLEHAGQSFADLPRDDEDENAYADTDDSSLDAQLARHADQVNEFDDASDLHDELLYNGVISGFSKAREDHSEHIFSYLKLMQTRGLKINDSIVRASTDSFVKFQNWALMLKLADYVDVKSLQNADLCFGDTISKLLEAEAWDCARHWIAAAHKLGVQPPIRGKMEILKHLREQKADEWRIAYALALETLSFKQMVGVNVESVADAVDICMHAGRSDLAMKLFDRMASHNSHRAPRANSNNNNNNNNTSPREAVKIPLRMYKQTVLALMREHTTEPAAFERNIRKAEAVCAQMLQLYSKELDGEALSMAISIKATVGDDDDVMALFESTQQLGLEPNTYAQNAAVVAFSRARRVDKVVEIRDQLLAKCREDASYEVDPNVLKSLLFSLAISRSDDALTAAVTDFPNCTTEHAVGALLQANRVENAVQLFDESVSSAMFGSLLKRICDIKPGHREHDPLTAAALLLKFVRFHGLEAVEPASRVLKVTKALVAYGHLAEAGHILGLYADPHGDVLLKDMKPFFQQEVMEMLLYIYGEQSQFENLGQLFERKILAFPLNVRHYEVAMEYAAKTRGKALGLTKAATTEQEKAGAVQCLKLFESLRQQFVKPNGAVYFFALKSSLKLKLLESTGKRVLDDALSQGFERMMSAELVALAAKALSERKNAAPAAPKRRGAPRKTHPQAETENPAAAMATAATVEFKVNVDELAQIALFCHHNGLEVTPKLAKKLLALKAHLPKKAAKEIEFIAHLLEDEVSTSDVEVDTEASSKARLTATAAAGSRWGDLYLSPLKED
ncbi:hypothetical protein Gpo141_00012465 [Globisporangium polare]